MDPLEFFKKYIARLDWTKEYFDERKAYVCCIFSQFAYRHIGRLELPDTDRLKLIPCYAYQEQLGDGVYYDGQRLLAELDLGESFVVETEEAIALGLVTAKLIVIAIRGTAKFYTARGIKDWSADLAAKKAPADSVVDDGVLHSGFYGATTIFCDKLSEKLVRWRWDDRPIYITGHSLGGAISAILHTYWLKLLPAVETNKMYSTAAYTFGMPRFGSSRVVVPSTLYHIYNPGDMLPTLPPEGLGYAGRSTRLY
jgi:predicted lipase